MNAGPDGLEERTAHYEEYFAREETDEEDDLEKTWELPL